MKTRKRVIKIGDLVIPEQNQILNYDPKGKQIVGSVFSKSPTVIKKELKNYLNKGYEFHYSTFKGNGETIHSVRVLKIL